MFNASSRFLVVDDTRLTRDFIRDALVKMGFIDIEVAADGLVALEKIKIALSEERPFQLLFTDINMPRMDGLKLLETLRDWDKTKDLPIIIVTTEGSKDTVIRAITSGISGYLVKPFRPIDVQKKVRELYDRANELAKAAR